MVDEIVLNGRPIAVNTFDLDNNSGFKRISIEFSVESLEYHDVTTLLYTGEFDVEIPAKDMAFRGKIVEYSTSVTNLYESGKVGTFKLALMEVKE